MTELEFHPVADIFPMMSDREFADLAADIAEHGLREPVWLHADGRIIDGRNRYQACQKGGLEPTFRTYDGDDAGLPDFVFSLNFHRRHLTPSQASMCAARKARYTHGGDRRSDQETNLSLETQSKVAEQFGVSVGSVKSARKVQESGVPELVEKVESGNLAVSTAAEIARAPEEEQRRVISLDDKDAILQAAKQIKRDRIEEARARTPEPVVDPIPVPDGKYHAFVIDPPWPMQKIEREERPNQGSALDYPTMDIWCQRPLLGLVDDSRPDAPPCFHDAMDGYEPCESIECVVGNVISASAMDDCHIYLWVTHKFLPAGLDLLESWGFNYQCVMTWRKNVGITPFSWMYDTEHVLFGRKGNLKLQRLGMRLSFEAPVRGHSAKPDVFYERVVDATPGPRLEMFARSGRDGFVGWGNEAPDEVV